MIEMLIGPIAALLDKVVPNVDERKRLAHEIATLAEKQAQERVMAQLEINRVAASHKSVFVSGGRPAAIWTCVIALFCILILFPFVQFFAQFFDIDVVMPQIDSVLMFGVLGPLLGLGGMRSLDKYNKVAREQ